MMQITDFQSVMCLRRVKLNFKKLLKGTQAKSRQEIQSEYMQRLKKDPSRWEQYKQMRREVQIKWRENRSEEKKAADRLKNKVRMAEKRKSGKAVPKTPVSKLPPRETRSSQKEKEKQREAWRVQKQERRKRMTPEEIEREKLKRKERYERSKAASGNKPIVSGPSPAKQTKYNAFGKIKKNMPKNKKTSEYVISQLVKAISPSKKSKIFTDLAKQLNIKLRPVKRQTKDSQAKKAAIDFFNSKSVDLPGKKQFSKRLNKQKKVLVEPISTLYKQFCTENPNIKLSKRLFFACRPRHVMPMKSLKFIQCLCEICQNAKFLLNGLKSMGCQLSSVTEALNDTLCAVTAPSLWGTSCVLRQCHKCGIDQMKQRLHEECQSQDAVTYKCWQLITEGSGMGTTRRTALVDKICSTSELVDKFCDTLTTLSLHVFTYQWQRSQFNFLKENLPLDTALLVLDFSENYSCKTQFEVQSAHWFTRQVTIHPVVVYTKCHVCNLLKTSYHVFVSDDINHDSAFVFATLQEILPLYSKSRVIIFSDNCAAQYKSKLPFHHMSKLASRFNIERCFFGERHGKSECDSCGGMVKAFLTQAALANQTLQNSTEIVTFLNSKLSLSDVNCSHSVRQFHLVKPSNINRRTKSSSLKTLPGTKKIHSFKVLNDQILLTRQFSCFCESCLLGNEHMCTNGMKEFEAVKYANAKKPTVSEIVDDVEGQIEEENEGQNVVCRGTGEDDGAQLLTGPNDCDAVLGVDDTGNGAYISIDSLCMNDDLMNVGFIINDSVCINSESVTPCMPDLDVVNGVNDDEQSTHSITGHLNDAFVLQESVQGTNVRKCLFSSPLERNDFFDIVYEQMVSCVDYKELKLVCESLTSNINSFPVIVGDHSILKNRLHVDKHALQQMPSGKPQGLLPVLTIGDGNCVPRSISTIVFGSSDHHKEIRCRIVHELISHSDLYLDDDFVAAGCHLDTEKVIPLIALHSDCHQGENTKNRDVCRDIFYKETFQVRELGQYMGMWQLLAAANVLRCVIMSYYPEKGSSKIQKCFGRGLAPRGTTLYDEPVHVLWTSWRTDMTNQFWVANHVVPLLRYN